MKSLTSLLTDATNSYTFKEDIDIVYKCFFNPSILSNVGLNGALFDLAEIKGAKLDKPNCEFKMNWRTKFEAKLDMITTEKIEEDCYRSIAQKIVKINEKEVTSNLFFKYVFYRNTSDNSTFVVFETHYESPEDPFFIELQKGVPKENKMLFFKQIEKYLMSSSKSGLCIDSIVVNRSIKQVWDSVSNFQEVLVKLYGKKAKVFSLDEENKKEDNKDNFEWAETLTQKETKMEKKRNHPQKTIIVQGVKNEFETKFVIKRTEVKKDVAKIWYEKEDKDKDGNIIKQTKTISVYRLSQVSCFVSIEVPLLNHCNGNYANMIKELHQRLLKKVKKNLEKMTCYFY